MTDFAISGAFAVLHHTNSPAAEDHYDLLIDTDGRGPLASWRLHRWPPVRGDAVTSTPPHRRLYLAFEGELTGQRGRVARVAGSAARIALSAHELTLRSTDLWLDLVCIWNCWHVGDISHPEPKRSA